MNMEMNLLSLVLALIALSGGLDASDQDFAGYVQAYEGPGWHDPYEVVTQNVTEIVYVNNTVYVPVIEYVNNCSEIVVPVNDSEPDDNVTVPVNSSDDAVVMLFTDTQIYSDDSKDRFNMLVDWANERSDVIDFAYGLGDQVDDENKVWQYTNFSAIDSRFLIGRDYVKGNHEGRKVTDWDDNDMVLEIRGDTCFALFNTYSEFQTHGSWTSEQIDWLDQALANNVRVCDYFVVLSHHAIFDDYGEKTAVTGVLEQYVDDYVSIKHYRGHNEWFRVHSLNGIDYITVPAVRQIAGDNNPANIIYNTMTGEDKLCYITGRCLDIADGVSQ